MSKKPKKSSKMSLEIRYIELGVVIVYIICSIAVMYISVKNYKPLENYGIDAETDVIDVIVNELGNAVTITSGIFILIAFILADKFKFLSRGIMGIVGVSTFLLFLFCRCANAVNLSANLYTIVVISVYIFIMLALLLVTRNSDSQQVNNIKLRSIVGIIRNQNILSIQLFSLEETSNKEYVEYSFKYVDGISQDSCDVNGILSSSYRLLKDDVAGFELATLYYEKIVDSGGDEEKRIFLETIEENKRKLLERLRKISCVEEVGKEECCIARLIILYLTLENMLKDVNCDGIVMSDGILGLENNEIEKKLFTLVRTGILGTVFWGENDIYTFHYRKDGTKVGRKYCSFKLKLPNSKKSLICLVVVKESSNSTITMDVIKAVQRIEQKILNNINYMSVEDISV